MISLRYKNGVAVVLCFLLILSCQRVGSSRRRAPRASTHVQIELPAIRSTEQVIRHLGYITSYNSETLNPNWVAYELTSEELLGQYKGKSSFCYDPDVVGRKSMREDYRNDENWDKGHMAPKADMKWSVQAYEESFFLSNICPQNHDLNSGVWLKTENLARRFAERYGKAYIICGPVFNEYKFGTLGNNKVWIPDAFFKAILVPTESGYESIAFLMPNYPQAGTLPSYVLTVNELESTLGRNLFISLDDKIEENVEDRTNLKFWGL